VLLFGIALVYGATGQVSLAAISETITARGGSSMLTLGTALVLGGLFFKAAAVPFQVWAPDVYEGAPTPVTAFLASLSKSAGFVLLLRAVQALVLPAAGGGVPWAGFLAAIAVLTLLYGNLGAIPQRDVKRMLAYSSIAHAGYLLIGVTAVVAAGTTEHAVDAAGAVLLYLFAYYLTTISAFAVVAVVSATSGGRHEASEAYVGLARRSPFLGVSMLFALLSLAGVPPMAGLIGKLLVFKAAVDTGLMTLALIGAGTVVVSLYYYLLLIKQMYVRAGPDDGVRIAVPGSAKLALGIGVAAMVALGIYWDPAWRAAREAAVALLGAR
jgi:NADH-quinone oxidoreductase subunit N